MEERVIGYIGSKALDIVTFTITPEEIALIGCTVLNTSKTKAGDSVIKRDDKSLFVGFPGKQRTGESERECGFGFFSLLTPVSTVSERHFGCAFDRSKWIDAIGKGLPEVDYDLGGISGAPVFIIKESISGIITWTLCGIVYNATNKNIGEIMFAHHSGFINENGTLYAPCL